MRSNNLIKKKAISLRKRGKSYTEICKILNISSKGTLSYWLKDLELSKSSQVLLAKNVRIAYEKGLYKANQVRNNRIANENNSSIEEGYDLIASISKKELTMIGATLYWGEGTKSEKRTSVSLSFCNSDALMVQVFMRFIREILKVSEKDIRGGIHLYSSIRINEAKNYWSKVTGIPIDRFYIVNQVSRSSTRKKPFNILPHGTVVIKANKRSHFYKIKGMIKGIIYKSLH